MKILIAITACHPRAHYCEAQRQTWLMNLTGADYKFFYGRGAHSSRRDDEVFLDVPDDYEHLVFKTQAMVNYAHRNGYDFVFKTDDDAYIFIERFIKGVPTYANYVGQAWGSPDAPHACGGGYWLSEYAMRFLIGAGERTYYYPRHQSPLDGNKPLPEDRWVGEVLKSNGIGFRVDDRYSGKESCNHRTIATWEFPGDEMYKAHEQFEEIK
jgi:hypothetical protein